MRSRGHRVRHRHQPLLWKTARPSDNGEATIVPPLLSPARSAIAIVRQIHSTVRSSVAEGDLGRRACSMTRYYGGAESICDASNYAKPKPKPWCFADSLATTRSPIFHLGRRGGSKPCPGAA